MPADHSETPADRVVEVYSAANVIEAQGLCAILEEEGIRSQIVGEQLGSAAGCLPLGETIAPRIWVQEGDAQRAREIIEDWLSESHQEWDEAIEGGEQDEVEDEPTEEDIPRAPGTPIRWLGQGCVIVGMACIVAGGLWAGHNWLAVHKHPATTEAVLVGGQPYAESYTPVPSDENIPGMRRQSALSVRYNLEYGFIVDGKPHYAMVQDGNINDRRVLIHFDPEDPERNIVGPLTRPWTILVGTWAIGALLSLGGYHCHRMARRYSPEYQPQAPTGPPQ